MRKTTMIFIRHGQSIGNRDGVFLGRTDLDLTDLGYRQAQAAAQWLDRYRLDAIYASDLMRAWHTAQAAARRQNVPMHPSAGMREIFAGKWENMRYDDIEVVYRDSYRVFREDIGHAVCDNGESMEHLRRRVVLEADRIAATHAGGVVLVGTHACPIRMLKCHWLGVTAQDAHKVPWTPNASITVTEYDNCGGYKIVLDGSVEHLDNLFTELPENV